ncbi:N-acetylglucosaminyltransferase, partial [Diplogelasinospora grovesii]
MAFVAYAGAIILGAIDNETADHFYSALLRRKPPIPDGVARRHADIQDVTIIVPTINTPSTFPESLRRWIANKPGQIIIETIDRDYDHVKNLIKRCEVDTDKVVKLHRVKKASKRHQVSNGIRRALGSFICLSDNDNFWPPDLLETMMAPFELNDDVGGVVGDQNPYVPPERQDPDVITPWEVAAIRGMHSRNRRIVREWSVDGGVNILAGRTVMYRAETLNKLFRDAFKGEVWKGKELDSGDDCFITRWLLRTKNKRCKNWKVHVLQGPESAVESAIETTDKDKSQLLRWEVNTLRHFMTTLKEVPDLWQRHPRLARKMVERLLRPVITGVHL